MQKEEDKLRKQSEREGKQDRKREEHEREKHGGDDSMKDLDWFLNRSQVGYSLLLPGCGVIICDFLALHMYRVFLLQSWIN